MMRRLQRWFGRFSGAWWPGRDQVRRAFVDQLTGLPTRYTFVEALRESRSKGVLGAVALIDVDLFKRVNDQYGHQAGDAVLLVFSRRLQSQAAKQAALARIGGDEFMVFLPGTDAAAARVQIEGLLAGFRLPIEMPDGNFQVVTASAGVADFTASIEDVFRATDIALYAAKARGRDRAVAFEDETRHIAVARRELAATVIELQERNRALRDEARTDALTTLRNRLALDEILLETIGMDGSPWAEAAVAFIDVDNFGSYNKAYSDAGGDEALRMVAKALRDASRHGDLAFRKGGEELVVVLAEVEPEAALAAAERLRLAVQALAIPHKASSIAPVLTVTVGVASGVPGCTIQQLMNAAAEQAMAAKVSGARNQVHPIHVVSVSTSDIPAARTM